MAQGFGKGIETKTFLPDYGEHLLDQGLTEKQDIHMCLSGQYILFHDKPYEWQLSTIIDDSFCVSLLIDNDYGERIKRDAPHLILFKARISPTDSFRDRSNNRVVPLRVLSVEF